MDIAVEVVGFGSTLDGTAQVIEPAADNDSDSARSFITINKNTFQLQPGESQNIATISIPADVGNGGRYVSNLYSSITKYCCGRCTESLII